MFFCSERICVHSQKLLFLLDEKETAIEPKQLQVLQLLMARPEQVVSKEVLLKSLWPDRIVSEASLFKLIANLRKTLKSLDMDGERIRTVHGQGYLFCGTVNEKGDDTLNQPAFKLNEKGEAFSPKAPNIFWSLALILVLALASWAVWQSTKPGISHQNSEKTDTFLPVIENLEELETVLERNPDRAIKLLGAYLNDQDLDHLERLKAREMLLLAMMHNARYEELLALIDEQISESKEMGEAKHLAIAFHISGNAFLELKNISKARFAYQSAYELFVSLNSWRDAGNVHLAQVMLEVFSGDPRLAEDMFIEIDEILEKEYNPKLAMRLANSRGTYYSKAGYQDQAIQYMDQAFDLALETNDLTQAARTMINAGISLQLSGDFIESANKLWSAIQLFPSEEQNFNLALAYNTLGNTAARALDFETAEYSWQKGLEYVPDTLLSRFESQTLLMKSFGAFLVNDYALSLSNAESFLRQIDEQTFPDSIAQLHSIMALCKTASHNPLSALESLSLAEENRTDVDDFEVDYFMALAYVYAYQALEKWDEAQIHLENAQAIIQRETFPEAYLMNPALLAQAEQLEAHEEMTALKLKIAQGQEKRQAGQMQFKDWSKKHVLIKAD